ncbi:hypothetical protein, partial [Nostoc sp.]|uniref:hypothetical protein n=1 Tax=Nostoc sp. TaxID=1180 RepID=UPI002FFA53B2
LWSMLSLVTNFTYLISIVHLIVSHSSENRYSASRVFDIASGVISAINGLTITNTYDGSNGTPGGGGISNEGVFTLNNSIITGNTVYHNAIDFYGNTNGDGGGIYNTGSLTVNYSTISNNSASDVLSANGDGGGIYNTGSLTVNYSNITGNTTGDGGGIYSDQDLKTDIKPNSVSVNYSTISHNSSAESGGGIYLYDGQVNYSIITNNSAGDRGGGILLLPVRPFFRELEKMEGKKYTKGNIPKKHT